MTLDEVKKSIRDVNDFPKKGIIFKDITTMLKNQTAFEFLVNQFSTQYQDKGITKVVGVESRGFILAGALAYTLKAGFVPVRKPGKLPAETIQQAYDLEYGQDILEIHTDALTPNDIVLLHDDVLATGGTIEAAIELVKKLGVKKVYVSFICELDFLEGRKRLALQAEDIFSLLHF